MKTILSTMILAAALAFSPPRSLQGSDNDVKDAFHVALDFAKTHLAGPRLFHTSGQHLFETNGRRVGTVKHSFVGQAPDGSWKVMKVFVRPDMSIDYDPFRCGPSPDHWKEHEKPGIQILAWADPSESVVKAVAQYPQLAPVNTVPMTYTWSDRLKRYAMFFHWIVREKLVDVTIDPLTGEVIEKMVSGTN